MRIFVTGASGFVGSAVVKDLLAAGHEVLGMVRSDNAVKALIANGAKAHLADLYDLESIKRGAAVCDAVIHTAFNHDFTKYAENCEHDRKVISAIGEVLEGTDKPIVVTSGIGLFKGNGNVVHERDKPSVGTDVSPRLASEEAAQALRAKGVNAYILRLPPTTHGAGDHGFIHMLIGIAKEKGQSVYRDNGDNQWSAGHRFDAASLYRLIVEQKPSLEVFHAAAEQGVPFHEIAETIGKGLNLPVVSKSGAEADAHFTWFSYFTTLNCAASCEETRKVTGWKPKEVGLLQDMIENGYFI